MIAVASHRLSRIAQGHGVWIGLGAAMAIYVGLEFWLTRGTTLFIDEVTIFRQNTGLHPSALLAPFNEHLELVRRLLYAVAFKLFSAGTSFVVAKIVEALGLLLLAGSFFIFMRRRLGATAALPGTVLLLFFGSAWELDFAISGIGNVYALTSGITALLLIERRGRRNDVAACLALALSVVSFSTGLAFATGALCLLLVDRDSRRRVWVALLPIGVYAAWLLWVRLVYVPAHGEAQHIALANVLLIPNEIAQQGAATAGALAGLNYNFEPSDVFGGVFTTGSVYGGLLAALGAAALAWSLRKGSTPMLWALLVVLAAYSAELAIGSGLGRTPSTVRYVYAAGTIWMLIAAEARRRPIPGRTALLVLGGMAAVSLLGNLARLRDGMHFYRTFGTAMRAQLTAIEIAEPSESPQFVGVLGSPQFAPVTAGAYLQAVRRNGSPAYTQGELAQQSATVRAAADSMLVAALRIALAQTRAATSGCRTISGSSGGTSSFTVAPPGVTLRSATAVRLVLARYSAGVPIGSLVAGAATKLPIPRDRSTRPWRLELTPAPAKLIVCALRASG